ncbi:MAG: efflux RND transporter periplasmic adaptor subunit [Bacteroidales bacterium]|nr:efflux RND transporter periplasmic adaptor subunit [Bacteroidales bacterium]
MKKQIYIGLTIAILIIIFLWYFSESDTSTIQTITVPVKKGEFIINVTTTGELEAKSSKDILGPTGLRSIRIWSDIKINKLIPEGTVVDSGDFVASLDQTEVLSKLKDLESEIEKLQSQITKTKLDTSLDLSNARDQIINMKYDLEDKQITLEQSKYESPATIRQVKIDLKKSQRALKQANENYKLKKEKAEAQMFDVVADFSTANRKRQRMIDILKQFEIYAPKSGMIIYQRNWRGKKREEGSTINSWDNIVAQLPDLSKMITKTYVNEIDISKVEKGQKVEIGVDAFPDKKFTGKITKVANIGQQLPNSNAKVFEVVISVNEFDSILRPAMTTKNTIITAIIDSVLYIPIECVHSNDSLIFVYKSREKHEIIVGKTNENEIIIKAGLKEDDKIYLVPPENAENFRLARLEPEIVEKFKITEEKQTSENDTIEKIQSEDKKLGKHGKHSKSKRESKTK